MIVSRSENDILIVSNVLTRRFKERGNLSALDKGCGDFCISVCTAALTLKARKGKSTKTYCTVFYPSSSGYLQSRGDQKKSPTNVPKIKKI